jgi:hypothetical protein
MHAALIRSVASLELPLPIHVIDTDPTTPRAGFALEVRALDTITEIERIIQIEIPEITDPVLLSELTAPLWKARDVANMATHLGFEVR